MLRVALSHDIDRTKKTYQYLTKPLRAIAALDIKALVNQFYSYFRNDNYWTFDDIIAIEKKFNVRSTFFFLNESIKLEYFKLKTYQLALGRYNIKDERIMALIKWLDTNGWEIGVHGSYNSYKDPNLLKKEKEILEEIVGHKIIGTRQHYLNLNEHTWTYHQKLGFKYDSSFGHISDIGFKEEKMLPFKPFNNDFQVIPLIVMDSNFMGCQNRWEKLEQILDDCENNNSVLVVNFHNHIYNEKEFPGYRDAYIKIIEMCKAREASFHTLSEIYDIYK